MGAVVLVRANKVLLRQPSSNPLCSNFSVVGFSETVRTFASSNPSGVVASISHLEARGWSVLSLAVGFWVGHAAPRCAGLCPRAEAPSSTLCRGGRSGSGRGYRTRNLMFLAFPRVLVVRPGLITRVYLCLWCSLRASAFERRRNATLCAFFHGPCRVMWRISWYSTRLLVASFLALATGGTGDRHDPHLQHLGPAGTVTAIGTPAPLSAPSEIARWPC